MTQNQMILQHLQSGKSLTPLDALKRFGCMRLAARVNDLKNDGHELIAKKETRRVRFGASHEEKSYCRYFLVKSAN